MRNNSLNVAATLFLVLASGFTLAIAGKPQTACPVSGKTIDQNVFVDHQGQRVFFCCSVCPAAFRANAEKYYAHFEREGVELVNIQTVCPVSGEALGDHGEPTTVRYKGRTVKFCCAACEKPFAREPEKYLDKLPGEKL